MAKSRILIGSDFSSYSCTALKVGHLWAQKLQAEAHALHINNSKDSTDALGHLSESEGVAVKGLLSGLGNSLDEKLKKQIEGLNLKSGTIKRHIHFGKKTEALKSKVLELNAKVLVLGSLGQGGFEDIFLGGTTERAIRSVPCPLLAVRDERALAPKKVLWATDLTEDSEFVFEWVKIIAEMFHPEITLLSICDDPLRNPKSLSKLESYRDQLRQFGIQVESSLMPMHQSSVEKALEIQIQQADHDLIIMGTQAKTGWRRFLLGSVAEYLTHHIRRSFFIVKHPDQKK